MESDRLGIAIKSAQAGEPEGFSALMDAYGQRLYGYFFRATASHHDAEDLLGEMMLRLVQRLKSYDDRGRFEPWLFRVAANMVRDRIRRVKTAPAITSLSADKGEGASLADQIPGENAGVEAGMLGAEASDELTAAMEKLDINTRQMILLRHFGDMSFKDIAKMFDCPLGTVLAKVHRGLRMLRELMSEQ
ncbi:MAG: sigma-70 family RNA polymerase sigma factor [Planctomycetaceae bacterium]|nr:MAG: sigma-70 family RNA polymerase sigma factor [Planctomycetaceae bacterium]